MLLREVEKFLRAYDVPATRLGRRAVGDPALVRDLRRGREPRAPLTARVRAFMADYAAEGSADA
jgi:hypothetical protein